MAKNSKKNGNKNPNVAYAAPADQFVNPYTFVNIEDEYPEKAEVPVVGETEKADLLSGVITCTMDIKSPLFIPDTNVKFKYLKGIDKKFDEEVDEHYFNDFFSYELPAANAQGTIPEQGPSYPRIPGSEIRGMIRNIYEQLTNSCLSVIDDKNLPYKRTGLPKEAALWDFSDNKLYKAERVMLRTTGRSEIGKHINPKFVKTGQKIYIKESVKTYGVTYCETYGERPGKRRINTKYVADYSTNSTTPITGFIEGYVLKGEEFGTRKHHDSVLIKSADPDPIKALDDKDIGRFEAVLERYEKYKDYKEAYENCKNNSTKHRYLPVFYSEVQGVDEEVVIYMSPAMITKEVFMNKISDILSKYHKNHESCSGKGGWCPACRLFGKIGIDVKSGETNANASRLRFSDSDVIEDTEFMEPTVLPVLGTPNYSATEFYLKKPTDVKDVKMWNYDYTISRSNNNTNTNNKSLYEPKLMGRKVYWLGKYSSGSGFDKVRDITDRYRQSNDKENFIKEKALKMRTAVRPLLKGKTKFNVYFEDITETELKYLLFCLKLYKLDNNGKTESSKDKKVYVDAELIKDKTYHRIGRGKPYGMGAVEIDIEKVELLSYTFNNEVEREVETKNWNDYKMSNDDISKVRSAMINIINYSMPLSQTVGNMVSYPCTPNSDKIYDWFSKNRGKLNAPEIKQHLKGLNGDEKRGSQICKLYKKLNEKSTD